MSKSRPGATGLALVVCLLASSFIPTAAPAGNLVSGIFLKSPGFRDLSIPPFLFRREPTPEIDALARTLRTELDEILTVCLEAYASPRAALRLASEGPLPVWLHANRGSLRKTLSRVPTGEAHGVDALGSRIHRGALHLLTDDAARRETLEVLLAEFVLRRIQGGEVRNTFVRAGLARLPVRTYGGWDVLLLARYLVSRGFLQPTAELLDRRAFERGQPGRTLPQAAAFARFLVETYGLERLLELARRSGGTGRSAFTEVYGFSPADADPAFHAWLLRIPISADQEARLGAWFDARIR